jgi:hypothetical protein
MIQGNNRAGGMKAVSNGITCSNFQNIHNQGLLVCFDVEFPTPRAGTEAGARSVLIALLGIDHFLALRGLMIFFARFDAANSINGFIESASHCQLR